MFLNSWSQKVHIIVNSGRNLLCIRGSDYAAFHSFSVELSVVIDLNGFDCVGLVDVDHLGRTGCRHSASFESADVPEQLDNVILTDRRLKVRDDNLCALNKRKVQIKELTIIDIIVNLRSIRGGPRY